VEIPTACGEPAREALAQVAGLLGDDAYPRRRTFQQMMAPTRRRDEE
jgi:hypothetical protein